MNGHRCKICKHYEPTGRSEMMGTCKKLGIAQALGYGAEGYRITSEKEGEPLQVVFSFSCNMWEAA